MGETYDFERYFEIGLAMSACQAKLQSLREQSAAGDQDAAAELWRSPLHHELADLKRQLRDACLRAFEDSK